MHNSFYFLLAGIISLQICTNVLASIKIDSTFGLINEELISDTITEKSKLEAIDFNDVSYLAIDHQKLKFAVEMILKNNLSFTNWNAQYYFYDSVSRKSCSIGNYYCNSVQIKLTIQYQGKTYEDILRYEPIPNQKK